MTTKLAEYRRQMEEFDKRKAAAQQACPAIYHSFKLHRIPRWFSVAFNGYAREIGIESHYGRADNRCEIQSKLARMLGTHIVDHWGSATLNSGGPCFVLQPYSIVAEGLAACEKLAAGMGIHCVLDPASLHYPGRTFSVVFYPGELFLQRTTNES
jgi:hypothetical protein